MKNLIFAICLFFGCAQNALLDQPDTLYADMGIQTANPEQRATYSLIASRIKNPMATHRLLASAAKLPVIWGQQFYADQFDHWAAKLERLIRSNLTYKALQDLLIMEISKFNTQAGLALLIIGDGVFIFSDKQLIYPMDQKLLLMSLDDLRAQVAALAALAR